RRTTLLLAAALVVLGGLGGAAIAWSALPARRAREALAGVRAMVDGDADAATALAVLELAEASARELGQPDLLAEAEDLRGAVRLARRPAPERGRRRGAGRAGGRAARARARRRRPLGQARRAAGDAGRPRPALGRARPGPARGRAGGPPGGAAGARRPAPPAP